VIAHEGKPIYIQTKGKTALASREKLVGHGILSHAEGFVANGKTKGINLAVKTCQRLKCLQHNREATLAVKLEFEGSIIVEGDIVTGSETYREKSFLYVTIVL
jgi:phenylalanine-4-hydroxylase